MILGCCVVTLASHDSLTLFANSLVFIGFHLLLSGSQPPYSFTGKPEEPEVSDRRTDVISLSLL